MAQIPEAKTSLSGETKTESVVVESGVNFFARRADLFSDHLERTRHLPDQLIARYIREAIKRANLRRLEDGTWFGDIDGFAGVWASAEGPEETLAQMREVLFDWIVLKVEHADRDLPIVGDINLNLI